MMDKKFILTALITLGILCTALALGEINPVPIFPTDNIVSNITDNSTEILNTNDTVSNVTDVLTNSTDVIPVAIDTNVTTNVTDENLTNSTTNETMNNLPTIDKHHISHGGTPMQDNPSKRSNYDNGYTDQQRPTQIRNGGTTIE